MQDFQKVLDQNHIFVIVSSKTNNNLIVTPRRFLRFRRHVKSNFPYRTHNIHRTSSRYRSRRLYYRSDIMK